MVHINKICIYRCMKNPLDILKEVKAIVFQEQAPAAPTTVEVPMYSLQDGTKLKISELAVGGVVSMEDGTPAPVGTHILSDGTGVEVGEGGVIANLLPKEEKEDMGARFAAYDEKFSAYESKFAAYEQKISGYESELTNLKSAFGKQNEALQGLVNLVDTIIKEPSQQPAEIPNTFKAHSTASKADKLKEYSQFTHQILSK